MTENTTLRSIKRWIWKESEGSLRNEDTFTRLYEQTYLIVFRYVYGLTAGSQEEAEDLTAETYTRAWKYRQRFIGEEQAVLGWLLRIARNLAIDASRRRKVRDLDESTNVEVLLDPNLAPEIDVITREQIALLWQMLGALSSEVREMIVLRYMLGWQVRQIARYLGMNENTISVTIRRTLKSLQRDWPQSQEKDNE
ncbi:MAG TPA: sigma-70 family RNA polymerase sigma factor [Anaerolineales bacterium]|nr:sigma-70 family RNA polymerase sigma factor [Anaerolineales bacterium]